MRSEAAPHRTGARLPLLAAALLLCLPAGAEPVQEADLKAAFVFNFAVFTVGPAEALAGGAPLSLCASAASPLLGALSQLNDKLVNGHRIAVRSDVPARACHVLVLDRGDRARWQQLKRELAGAPVLTVADDHAIGGDGAVIALAADQQRIGFDVHLAAARGARLNLSSKLLRLARSVQ